MDQGRHWNEQYLLRAFPQNNAKYEIVLFNDFLGRFHREAAEKALPLSALNPGGSLWLRKVS